MDKDAEIDDINSKNVRAIKEKIKARRLSLGMNQMTLAEHAGVKQPSISILESKNNDKVTLDLLTKVASALGMAVEILLIDPEEA